MALGYFGRGGVEEHAYILILGVVLGFLSAVLVRTFEARQKCYAEALRLAAQYISSNAFSVQGKPGKAEKPSSLEINQTFSELLLYSRRGSSLPKKFMDFFCQKDGDLLLTEMWPDLVRSIRKELWVLFMPKIPENVLFRWSEEHQ